MDDATASLTPAQKALRALLEGNAQHFAPDEQRFADPRRDTLASGQAPLATVLACADSRVGPELVFHRPQGEVFVIRNAGYVLDDATVATIEYGVLVLGTPLVVVMGHTNCGAVAAALDPAVPEGSLGRLVERVRDSIGCSAELHLDPSEAEIRHVAHTARALSEASPELKSAFSDERGVMIVPLLYDLGTGTVQLVREDETLDDPHVLLQTSQADVA